MKKLYKIILFLSIQCLCWTSVFGAASFSEETYPRILFISSYNSSFHSYFDQLDGFAAGLHDAGLKSGSYILDVEFLDSKRFPYPERAKRLHRDLTEKLKTLPPYDLVVTADDNALKFAKERLDTLFNGASIVFLGVNDIALATAQNSVPRITGVVEALSIDETLSLAHRLFPAAGKIHVITDDTQTGRANRHLLERARQKYPAIAVEIHFLGRLSYTQLFDRLGKLPDTTPVMLTSIFRDVTGDTMNYPEFFERLRTAFEGPVFSAQGNVISRGALGGKVVSQFEQGRSAAGLVARILAGTPTADLKVVTDSPNLFTVDYGEMQRLGIREDRLPTGSKILNRPPSIFDEYAHWVLTGIIVFVVQLILIAVLVVSIRQKRKAEGALRHAIEVAESASQAKTAFLANMSHELRTPLNSILGFAELIRAQALGPIGNPKYAEFIGDIHDSGAHLLRLINGVLDLSKIEAGKMQLDETSVPVDPLARDCVRSIEPLATGAKINLKFTPPVKPFVLRADGTKLRQVLINLLSNAVKFTGPGGTVDFSIHRDDDNTARFVVSDTGIGMTPEDVAIAVSLFGQVEDHMVRRHDGTGLGLPLARKLAELHGGSLQIDSTPGEGTTVTVILPASRIILAATRAA